MNQLNIFKKMSKNDQRNLINSYYKDKSFRLLLKNVGLGDLGKILVSVGSSNDENDILSWQGNEGLAPFVFASIPASIAPNMQYQAQTNNSRLGNVKFI